MKYKKIFYNELGNFLSDGCYAGYWIFVMGKYNLKDLSSAPSALHVTVSAQIKCPIECYYEFMII